MPAKSNPRVEAADSKFYYRRSLSVREVLPAIGAGVAAGLLVFYIVRLSSERTPLASGSAESRRVSRTPSRARPRTARPIGG
jgi:hypothetical protein